MKQSISKNIDLTNPFPSPKTLLDSISLDSIPLDSLPNPKNALKKFQDLSHSLPPKLPTIKQWSEQKSLQKQNPKNNNKREHIKVSFSKEMKKTHTILVPMMLPIHFRFLVNILHLHGYKAELLHNDGKGVVDEGLRNVHNDTCYPALLVIGQMIDALKSGKYDLEKVAKQVLEIFL